MSRLLLVRHGQARAFDKHADKLTPMGETQARAFGAWLGNTAAFELNSGTLLRQQETAALIRPAQTVLLDPRWNEYDAIGLMEHGAPALAAADPAFAALLETANRHRQQPDANRYFQPMFEALLHRWIAGEIEHNDVEPWPAFLARVGEALDGTLSRGKRDVLVVTSGGVIAAVVQRVLQAPPRMALELNWRMRNASLTELLFTKGRVSLDSFNATPHLTPDQITYR
ncbi:MAG: histidine phosphatase family protein [Bryobacterales bacterium]|nr:histidine phosphatase family protein [Bryobacterales bacterium]